MGSAKTGIALGAVALFVFIGATAMMAFAMMGSMAGMHPRGGGSAQTPVISDASQITAEIRDFEFLPDDLTITAGSRVTWVNRDGAPHDATDEDGAWGTGTLGRDDSATVAFDEPGTFRYLCTIHPSMKATLTVLP